LPDYFSQGVDVIVGEAVFGGEAGVLLGGGCGGVIAPQPLILGAEEDAALVVGTEGGDEGVLAAPLPRNRRERGNGAPGDRAGE